MLATSFLSLASATGAMAAAIHTRNQFDASAYAADDIIERDFAIIGGGAAGTYAAVSLADQNHTFTLVEISDRLGGHTRTFHDPATGASVDFGVQIHLDVPIVQDFFTRLNSSLAAVELSSFGTPKYYDFTKQVALPNHTAGTMQSDYVTLLNKYPYVDDLVNLPDSVPSDLLLAWPEFAQKHNLSQGSTEAGLAWPATPGDPLSTTALAILNDGNHIELAEDEGGAVHNANNDNSQIYTNALAEFQPHILLNSSIVAAQRGLNRSSGVQLVASTPEGKKLIKAKQLILAMPPVLDNTKSFNLDTTENSILGKLSGKYYYGGVVNNTGLEEGIAYTNVGVDRPYNAASLPGVVEIAPSAYSGYQFYWYNTEVATTQEEVQAAAKSTIQWLQTQNNVTTSEPNFLDYQDFSPFHLSPPNEDVEDGWYTKMKGLQGHRNTWYISSLFVVGSTQVWNSTNILLPDIISAAQA
ncbi:putative FAD dependent oxidoreductase [Aspergillus sclerotioniger CBS 115572]|uniref:Putative FAD dependent oxidoreductase n=1 Tax=Aspergillus sclerotioniger CBS 115572 TaxID=1450535 RepID=A0A317X8K2_9EURO|nr:putative FAD dependent oxidoreductase [Aspergillus sclerotioniger CBS 115572]PWY94531.1 putative FAD dependent oxidoreductase [Aspergillus sclerotioniger CBS 115572]